MDEVDPLFFADNEFGQKAKSMLYDDGTTKVKPTGKLLHNVKLPDLEAPWVRNCFHALQNNSRRPYEPGDDDLRALLDITHFDIEVGFKLSINGSNYDDMPDEREARFRSVDQMMVAIEGLCWK